MTGACQRQMKPRMPKQRIAGGSAGCMYVYGARDSSRTDEVYLNLGQRARQNSGRGPATKRKGEQSKNETSKQQRSCQWLRIKERRSERVEEQAWRSQAKP
jgi:hypothetical protein